MVASHNTNGGQRGRGARHPFTFLFFLMLLSLAACVDTGKKPHGVLPRDAPQPLSGELAFLLDYDRQLPENVGFLTNHVVERRLANLLKDSFAILISKTRFSVPLNASQQTGLVKAAYFFDAQHTRLSAVILIDVRHDSFWVNYSTGSRMVTFADDASLPAPTW